MELHKVSAVPFCQSRGSKAESINRAFCDSLVDVALLTHQQMGIKCPSPLKTTSLQDEVHYGREASLRFNAEAAAFLMKSLNLRLQAAHSALIICIKVSLSLRVFTMLNLDVGSFTINPRLMRSDRHHHRRSRRKLQVSQQQPVVCRMAARVAQ
jgi:hypothetical protein